MKICHIIGALIPENNITFSDGDLVIAADAGYSYFEKHNISPDLIVGDFDSLGSIPSGANVIAHPVMKDDTDMMLAVKLGFEKGYKTFILYGGIGGRLDHTIANIQTLAYIASRGGVGYLTGDDTNITVIKNSVLSFSGSETGTVSVFALGDKAEGVTLKGLLYPLNDAALSYDFPIGVSNKFTSDSGFIEVQNGTLAVIWNGDFHIPIVKTL